MSDEEVNERHKRAIRESTTENVSRENVSRETSPRETIACRVRDPRGRGFLSILHKKPKYT